MHDAKVLLEMNPWLVFGPLGMVLVGLLSIAFWWRRTKVAWTYFLWGGVVWGLSILPKTVLYLTVTPLLSSTFVKYLGLTWSLIAMGVYAGLRTGFFECGATYIAVDKTRLRGASLDEATAFGVGFGAVEAILLGLPSAVFMLMLILNPEIISKMPPEYLGNIQAQLNSPTWVVPAPVLERVFTLFVHVFASLLVFSSVKQGRPKLLTYAVAYKSLLDAAIPYLQWALSNINNAAMIYLAETWVVLLGALGLYGSHRIRGMKGTSISEDVTC